MSTNALQRFVNPDLNVGGGDFAMRVIASLVLLLLSFAVAPALHVPYPLQKIALLSATELGLMCVMLGMFFKSKTYFAGFQLFCGSLSVLALASKQVGYAGLLVGLLFVALGIYELVTKRSRLNALLGVSSYRRASANDVNLIDAALLPDAPTQVRPPAPLAPLHEGKA